METMLRFFLLAAIYCTAVSGYRQLRMSSNPFASFFTKPSSTSSSKPTVIAITGASGLVGTGVTKLLESQYNANVIKITTNRNALRSEEDIFWEPSSGTIDEDAVDKLNNVDAIIHLAGENVASGEPGPLAILGTWSDAKKQKIFNSRVQGTQLIVETIGKLKNKPKVFISASAVGFYGYTDSNTLFDEGSKAKGEGFLAEVVDAWESEALKAEKKGVRTVCLRFAPIFSSQAGILAKLLPLFNLCAGGVIGNGSQGFSWVTLNDAVRSIEFLLFDKKARSLKGPVNVCSPNPVDNAVFTSAMGSALGRPAVFPLPAVVASTVFGEMGTEMLLGGQKAVPKRLVAAGFEYEDADIVNAIKKNSK